MKARWTRHLTEYLVAIGLLVLGIVFGAMSPAPGQPSAKRMVGSLVSSEVGRADLSASVTTADGWSANGADVWPGAAGAGALGLGDGWGAPVGESDAGAAGPMVDAAVLAIWGAAGGAVAVSQKVPSAPGSGTTEPAAARVPPAGTPISVPRVLWNAYEGAVAQVRSSCHLPATLLAAIGQVESGSLAGRALTPGHDVVPPVLGPVLSGGTFAAIPDTDGGRLDGDPVWDRAVGPMQFIPGTWRVWGRDGNGDGVANPQNVDDAALSAATYLCAGGRDLSDPAQLRAAILSYNSSSSYAATVLRLMGSLGSGGASLPGVPVVPATVTVTAPRLTTTATMTSTVTSTVSPTQRPTARPSPPVTVTQTVLVTVTASPPIPTSTTSTTVTSKTTTTAARAAAPTSAKASGARAALSPTCGPGAGGTATVTGTPAPPDTSC